MENLKYQIAFLLLGFEARFRMNSNLLFGSESQFQIKLKPY